MLRNIRLILAAAALWSVLLACGPSNPLLQPRLTATPKVAEKAAEAETTEQPEASPTSHTVLLPDVQAGETPAPQAAAAAGDPYVIVEATPTELKVGETLTLTGKPSSISSPTYYLIFRDEGVQDAAPAAHVSAANPLTALQGGSAFLELVSAEATAEGVTFLLRAKAAGVTTVQITAVGEVNKAGGGVREGEGWGAALVTVK